jgi:hypothetical protein
MALIDCPECGWEVSDTAAACPKCAYRLGAGAPAVQPSRSVTRYTKSAWWTAASIVGRIGAGVTLWGLAPRGGSGGIDVAVFLAGLLIAGSAIPTWFRYTAQLKERRVDTGVEDRLEDRILDMEHVHREQIAELEERVDFAERLLTKQQEQIGPG